jgi:hypothetical protein
MDERQMVNMRRFGAALAGGANAAAVEQAQERADYNANIKAVRQSLGSASMQLGHAIAQATSDPERALADLDSAIGLLKASRDLYAAITKPE